MPAAFLRADPDAIATAEERDAVICAENEPAPLSGSKRLANEVSNEREVLDALAPNITKKICADCVAVSEPCNAVEMISVDAGSTIVDVGDKDAASIVINEIEVSTDAVVPVQDVDTAAPAAE